MTTDPLEATYKCANRILKQINEDVVSFYGSSNAMIHFSRNLVLLKEFVKPYPISFPLDKVSELIELTNRVVPILKSSQENLPRGVYRMHRLLQELFYYDWNEVRQTFLTKTELNLFEAIEDLSKWSFQEIQETLSTFCIDLEIGVYLMSTSEIKHLLSRS